MRDLSIDLRNFKYSCLERHEGKNNVGLHDDILSKLSL